MNSSSEILITRSKIERMLFYLHSGAGPQRLNIWSSQILIAVNSSNQPEGAEVVCDSSMAFSLDSLSTPPESHQKVPKLAALR